MIKLDKNILRENIQYLKGVGPARALLLNKLGIYTYSDLLEYYPREYENRTIVKKIGELVFGDTVIFFGKIATRINIKRVRKNLVISSFFVEDEMENRIQISIFNQTYMKNKLNIGEEYVFYGKVEGNLGKLVVEIPLIVDSNKLNEIKGIFPIYPLTKGLTNNYITKLERVILNSNVEIEDIFSECFRKKYDLCDLDYATRYIHFPNSFADVDVCRKRIIFEELLLLQLALMNIKNKNITEIKGIEYKKIDYEEFKKLLPFELTNAQKRCIDEILKDMQLSKPMNRLVQGDVGCGKTIIAAIAIYIAVKNGYQGAMMAPTTILANQHYGELKQYFDKLNISSAIITSNTTKKNKENIIEGLKERKNRRAIWNSFNY